MFNLVEVEVNVSTSDELRGLDLTELLSLDRNTTVNGFTSITIDGFTIKQNPYIVAVLC